MIDLHCHLLPAVDDGSESVEQSLVVLQEMANRGVTDICLTPHLSAADLYEDRLSLRLTALGDAFDSLHSVAGESPRLHRGVELMLNEALRKDASIDHRLSLAGSRYLLIEFPRTLSAPAMRGLINQITARGFIPVVAHPERYSEGSVKEVFAWRDLGAAIQVDATTIAENRSARGARARALIEAGLADILAADNHGDGRMLPTASTFLNSAGAAMQAELLLTLNPLAILEDRAVDPVPSTKLNLGWTSSLRQLLPQNWLRRAPGG